VNPETPYRSGLDPAAEFAERTAELLARDDKELEKVDEDIREAEKKLDWLRHEPSP
jgi:hypothetical protein